MNAPAAPVFTPVRQEELEFLGTEPIPASAYFAPDWYERERKAVFLRSWINIGHTCEIPVPGDFIHRQLEFATASLLIVRGKGGEVRAFHNACTHRGTRLVREAEGRRAKFTCPYHMWTFGQDGALLSAPDFESFHVDKQDCSLRPVRIEVVAGLIFVNLDPAAVPLREQLGVLADEMDTLLVGKATHFSEYTYEIGANWKIVYDNFQENYHLRFIHSRTGGAGIAAANPFGYPVRYRFQGTHRSQTIWSNPAPGPRGPVQTISGAAALAALSAKGLFPAQHGQEYYGLFPTLFMLGNPFQSFSHVVYPIDAGRTRGVIRLYAVGEPDNASELFARQSSLTMLRDLHAEDIDVIEDGFKGLSGGGIAQIHFQTQEALCRHLYNSVASQVQAFEASQSGGAA